VVGRETGAGTLGSDGVLVLRGGWNGKRDKLKANYSGKLAGGEAMLTGKHVMTYEGRSYDRSCTMTVRKR
jgi:hypothetical protein